MSKSVSSSTNAVFRDEQLTAVFTINTSASPVACTVSIPAAWSFRLSILMNCCLFFLLARKHFFFPLIIIVSVNWTSPAWEVLRELTNKKSSPLTLIKGSSTTERLQSWYQHFSILLGSTAPEIDLSDPFYNHKISDPLPINTRPFTLKEIQDCLAKVSNTKTPGPDNIPAILWKHPMFHELLLYFCNETFEGNKPESFSKSCILPIPKKGDLQNPQNYRGITLSAIASNIYNSLILNRIAAHLDPILRPNQNGFRKGRSTLPQILYIRRIIEELRTARRNATIVFIDFSKAFDSVNRKVLLHILTL